MSIRTNYEKWYEGDDYYWGVEPGSFLDDLIRLCPPSADKKVATSSKIDQKNVKEYVSFARTHFSDAELASFQQQGREAIIADIPKMGIIETAQANAAKVLVPMLVELGYEETDITIAFRKDLKFDKVLVLDRGTD